MSFSGPLSAVWRRVRGWSYFGLPLLGVVVAIVGSRVVGPFPWNKPAIARAQVQQIQEALREYRIDVGTYPATLDALTRRAADAGAKGPYLETSGLLDPWGRPYQYTCCPGRHGDYDLWSEGADGAPGGDGDNSDIVSWQRSPAAR